MKVKTSITINDRILKLIDKNLVNSHNRSQFIETAIVYYLKNYQKSIRDTNDTKILNQNSVKLNKEAEEVLSFQDW